MQRTKEPRFHLFEKTGFLLVIELMFYLFNSQFVACQTPLISNISDIEPG